MRGRPPRLSQTQKLELRLYREAGASITRLCEMWKLSRSRVHEILAEQRERLGPEKLPEHKRQSVRLHLFTSGKSERT